MKKYQILIVEDEKDVRELIQLQLTREGYDCLGVENAQQAFEVIENTELDLIVLDWMLPETSGLEVCKRLGNRIHILMVTARAETADIVLGIEMGADDYVTKPFEIPVLLARVRSLLRRTQRRSTQTNEILQVGELRLDFTSHRVQAAREEVSLTPSEFRLLAALLENEGKVLSRDRLMESVQGEGVSVIDRAIDTHVFGLRKKLGLHGKMIETIRGVGYRVSYLEDFS